MYNSEETKAKAIANLKPAKKGEVRNPHGRWGKAGIEGSFKGMLHKILFDKGIDGNTRAEMIMEVLIGKAMEGDTKAIDMIMDRVEGKVKETVKVESEDGLACMILPNKKPKEIEEGK
jgi:hypothetical protein